MFGAERTPWATNGLGPRRLELGELGGIDGPRMLWRARELGLQVEAQDRSSVTYQCFNRTRNFVLLVEDPVKAEGLAAEMLAAGVPLVHVHID